MRPDAIMEEFWIFQDSEYAKFLHMQGSEYAWIWLNMAGFWICLVNVSQGFK